MQDYERRWDIIPFCNFTIMDEVWNLSNEEIEKWIMLDPLSEEPKANAKRKCDCDIMVILSRGCQNPDHI